MAEHNTITVPTTEVITDLAKVDEHLSNLYRRAAGAEAYGAAVPVVRALLLNLIVYVRTEEEAEQAARDVGEVAGNHPCRAIIVEAMSPAPGEPPAIVTAVCGITDRGDRMLCGEIITIHSPGDHATVAGSVIPLLVPDVPVFLWTPGEVPVGEEQFEALLEVADHVLLDSRRFADLRSGLDVVPRFCSHDGLACTVTDLAWVSLQPWRELTAQHFDPPGQRERLARLQRVDVSFGPHEREDLPPSAPLFLACWFMGCTGLAVDSVRRSDVGGFVFRAHQSGVPVEVRLSPSGRGLPAGRVGAIVVRGGGPGDTATHITKSVSMTELVITEECPGVCLPPQSLDLPPQAEAALAAQALDSYRRDPLYENALSLARDVLGRFEPT